MLAPALVVALAAGPAYAQQTPPVPDAAKAGSKSAPPEGLPTNIKVELTITDQSGPAPASKRTVSMMVADRSSGSVRSQGQAMGGGRTATLNADASPIILEDGQMRLQLGLEYLPKPSGETENLLAHPGSLNQRITLIVQSGKPTIVSQASDPNSDRKMTVELTATIQK
jgi:hypothetical protein